jgi:hypothetical protein
MNGEIKRRMGDLGAFPNEVAFRRLVGAMLREKAEELAVRCS